ncbi:MAG: von Willebrand factor type A domain-containing protein [Clostridia bacterium]|nr:von Willebrand factor type A domain-containing protein [Clostridia bacterium]
MMKRLTALLLAVLMGIAAVSAVFGEEAEHIWRKGDTGEKVSWIQQRLIDLGYLEGESTGVFDEATEAAVLWFQQTHNLLETGMADAVTCRLLEEEQEPVQKENSGGYGWDLFGLNKSASYAAASSTAVCYEETEEDGYYSYEAYPSIDGIPFSTDEYKRIESNRFLSTLTSPLSTFAADVDTSSYAQLRRRILNGDSVPADSVRIEEMLNYFRYDYRQPTGGDPFGVTVEYADCPWNEQTKLLQIGLQARKTEEANRPGHNLVFLIDTSGSMEGEDRLDLVKRAFLMLLEELKPEDTVSIVAYASQDRVVLEGARAGEKTRIMEAISELEAYGSTNGSAGILRAYEIAGKYYVPGGVNRILLATDGDLNVGVTSEGELVRMVEEKRQSGISLTCMGFGMGNYKDNKMEALADYGNGNCWYIDTIHEARKALVTEGGGTFITVAKDVKIQVDFNPALVKGYRLIGYEDRVMAAEDFADDTKDGGEIGSGHRMTALYEIVPIDSEFDFGGTESRYQNPGSADANGELLTVSIRAKEPEGTESRLYEYPVQNMPAETLSDNMKFAAAVAETGMLLRDSEWKGTSSYEEALKLLRDCGSVTGDACKEEFLYLVTLLQREADIR